MTSPCGNVAPSVYKKLSHSNAFRVFNIWPDGNDSIIRGSLIELMLDDAISKYHAISYVWGDATEVSNILCDGQSLIIPASLCQVLRRIRRISGQKPLYIWADSICINQATESEALKERSVQVEKMNRIFSSAEQVYIDLHDVSSEAYNNMIDLHKFFKDVSWTGEYPDRLRLDLRGEEILPHPDHPGWHSLADFTSQPWFTRMWVMQEFAVAKKAVLLFGTDTQSDPDFLEQATKCACYFLYNDDLNRHPALAQVRYRIIQKYINIGLLHKLRVTTQSQMRLSLQLFLDVLVLRENFEATDDRDFVYALLGLAPTTSATMLAADYNEHSHELGKRLYLFFLAHGYGVYGLYQSLGIESSTVSWSVRLQPQPRDLFSVIPEGTSERANACGNTKAQIDECDDPSCLKIKAFLIDGLSLLFSEPIPHITPSMFSPAVLEPWLYKLFRWLMENKLDPLEDDIQRLSSTLCCGQYTSESDSILPSHILPFIYNRIEAIENGTSRSEEPRPVDPRHDPIYSRVLIFLEMIRARMFAISTRGWFCFVPKESQPGDQLAIILGAPQPFVLRPVKTEDGHAFFRIVGACYVDGMMQGEVLKSETRFEPCEIFVL